MAFQDHVYNTFPDQADAVLGFIRGQLDPSELREVATWIAQCYNRPSRHELIAAALNVTLSGYGVEAAFRDGEVQPYLEWINMGDTYAPTLIHYRGTWRVGCWGDYAEAES